MQGRIIRVLIYCVLLMKIALKNNYEHVLRYYVFLICLPPPSEVIIKVYKIEIP